MRLSQKKLMAYAPILTDRSVVNGRSVIREVYYIYNQYYVNVITTTGAQCYPSDEEYVRGMFLELGKEKKNVSD